MTTPSSQGNRIALLALIVAALLLVPVGFLSATSLKVLKGTSEKGFGARIFATGAGNWWTFTRLTSGAAPSGLGSASVSASSPTIFSNNSSTPLALGTVSGGSFAYIWIFQVSVGAPASTELKLNVSMALLGAPTVLLVYLEVPSGGMAGGQAVRLFFLAPGFSFSGTTIQSFSATSSICTSVGVCP